MRPLLFKDTTWFSQGYQYSLNTTHFYSGIQERHQIQRTTCELSNCDFILPSTSFDIAAPFAVQKIDAHGQHLWVEFEKGSCILLTVAKANIKVVGCFLFFLKPVFTVTVFILLGKLGLSMKSRTGCSCCVIPCFTQWLPITPLRWGFLLHAAPKDEAFHPNWSQVNKEEDGESFKHRREIIHSLHVSNYEHFHCE